jgi:3-dehydroquinate dehydratase-2
MIMVGVAMRKHARRVLQAGACRFGEALETSRMAATILILNGPNLNLLGVREPEIYGHDTLEDIKQRCLRRAQTHDLVVDFKQSNSESALIDWIHAARGTMAGIIINPAGLSFHSISLLDSLKMFDGPKVEVHITNIHKREPMYQKSLISHGVTGVIAGLGPTGYELAIDAIAATIKK